MGTFSEQILKILDEISINEEHFPVLVKVNNDIQYLGQVKNLKSAEILGLEKNIICERISRAKIINDEREFIILH